MTPRTPPPPAPASSSPPSHRRRAAANVSTPPRVDRLAFGDWAVGVSAGIDAFVNVIGKIFGIGAARGMRATFAAPEEFDVEGPYGVEPFPFQTPGAEKCHRMLNSWLYKCERNG